MVLLPGCSCCAGAVPCDSCQAWCAYQITVDRQQAPGDALGDLGFCGGEEDPPPEFKCGQEVAGPGTCFGADSISFFYEGEIEAPGNNINLALVGSELFPGPDGSISYVHVDLDDERSGSSYPLSSHWVTDSYEWTGDNVPASPVYRIAGASASWAVRCEDLVVGGETTKCVVLTAELETHVSINTSNSLILAGQYNPPYVFDGHEGEFPSVNKTRTRSLSVVLAVACQSPDPQTAACSGSENRVVGWRPSSFAVTMHEGGVTLATGDGVAEYGWDTDGDVVVEEGWYEFEEDGITGNYYGVFSRAANGEPYFDYLEFAPITWTANLISAGGDATVTVEEFCDGGLTPLIATEDVITVDEDTPLPLGEEQAAYVNAYDSFSPEMEPCVVASYPSWSVYWKTQHLLITDMNVQRCGTVPSVTTFKVWFYIDGLFNDEEVNYIGGTPVNGFVMAVRSWDVEVRAGRPPVITLASSSSPCSTTGEMPYCDDAIPEFVITYSE